MKFGLKTDRDVSAIDVSVFDMSVFECERMLRGGCLPHEILLFANSTLDLVSDHTDVRGLPQARFLRPSTRSLDAGPCITGSIKSSSSQPTCIRVVLSPALLSLDITLADRLYCWTHLSTPPSTTTSQSYHSGDLVEHQQGEGGTIVQLEMQLLRIGIRCPIPTFTQSFDSSQLRRAVRNDYRDHAMLIDVAQARFRHQNIVGASTAFSIEAQYLSIHLISSANFEPKAMLHALATETAPISIRVALQQPNSSSVTPEEQKTPFTARVAQREGSARAVMAASTDESLAFEAQQTALACVLVNLSMPSARVHLSRSMYEVFNVMVSDLSSLQPWSPNVSSTPVCLATISLFRLLIDCRALHGHSRRQASTIWPSYFTLMTSVCLSTTAHALLYLLVTRAATSTPLQSFWRQKACTRAL